MKNIKKEFFSALEGEKEVWKKNSSSLGRAMVICTGPFIMACSIILGIVVND